MQARKGRGESGAVMIVEATFVFPIMFIIVFIMIMAGNAYFQHARAERLVIEASLDGASRCENPMLELVTKNGHPPTSPSTASVMPYRYLFTGNARKIADQVAGELKHQVEGLSSFAFRGMEPKNVSVTVTPKMYVLVSNFQVECEFDVVLPIRMLFSNENVKFHYTICMVEPIGDPTEFVRNVSTVQDIIERNETASNVAGKFSEAAQSLARFIN